MPQEVHRPSSERRSLRPPSQWQHSTEDQKGMRLSRDSESPAQERFGDPFQDRSAGEIANRAAIHLARAGPPGRRGLSAGERKTAVSLTGHGAIQDWHTQPPGTLPPPPHQRSANGARRRPDVHCRGLIGPDSGLGVVAGAVGGVGSGA